MSIPYRNFFPFDATISHNLSVLCAYFGFFCGFDTLATLFALHKYAVCANIYAILRCFMRFSIINKYICSITRARSPHTRIAHARGRNYLCLLPTNSNLLAICHQYAVKLSPILQKPPNLASTQSKSLPSSQMHT